MTTHQEGLKRQNLLLHNFLSELFYFEEIIRKAMKDSTTASSDHQATNTPASDTVTEAATQAATTASDEIEEEAADALGELGNLADLGF